MSKTFYITNLTDPAADIQAELDRRGITRYGLYKMSNCALNRMTLERWLSGEVYLKVKDMVSMVKALGYDEIVIRLRR